MNAIYFFVERRRDDGGWEPVVEEGDRDKDQKPRLWQCERIEEARRKVAGLKGGAGPSRYRIAKRTRKEGRWINEPVEEL